MAGNPACEPGTFMSTHALREFSVSGRHWRLVIYSAGLLLAVQSPLTGAQNPPAAPAANDLRAARLGWGSDPAKRCPELRQTVAQEGAVAVMQFMVGPTGVPSRASIHSSSGSAGDAVRGWRSDPVLAAIRTEMGRRGECAAGRALRAGWQRAELSGCGRGQRGRYSGPQSTRPCGDQSRNMRLRR